MSHIKLFEEFILLNEAIEYRDTQDADLESLCSYIKDCKDIQGGEEKLAFVKEWLKNIKPVSLTGKVRTDAPALTNYIIKTFKQYGIELDARSITVSSENFPNEIEIAFANKGDEDAGNITFNTSLDYNEIAYGADGRIGGNFSLDGELLDGTHTISDLSNGREIAKCSGELQQWLKTRKYK
jgi:hypothetical protein